MNKVLIGLITVMLSFPVFSAVLTTDKGTIKKLHAYDDYGVVAGRDGADIVVWMQTGLAGCEDGVWLSPSAPGYKMIGSFLLTAYTTKQQVLFRVYSDRVWPGTNSAKLCQIDAIKFE